MRDNSIPARTTATVIQALYQARSQWQDDRAAAAAAGLHTIADQFGRQIDQAGEAIDALEQ